MKYDAILFSKMDPVLVGQPVYGAVYEDSMGRFKDGTGIRTSRLKEVVTDEFGKYIVTLNTVYKLVSSEDEIFGAGYDTHEYADILKMYENRPLYVYVNGEYYRVRGFDFGHHKSIAVIDIDKQKEFGYDIAELVEIHGE